MKNYFKFTVFDLVEISSLTALAVVFDRFVRIPLGVTGGSLNIAVLFLIIIALRHGPFKAFIASGLVFGLITNLLDGYGLNTYPLEYLVAFGSVSIFGFFAKLIKNNEMKKMWLSAIIIIGCSIVFMVIRTLAATFDSMLFYGYDFISALVYNITYIIPSGVLVTITSIVLLPGIISVNKQYPSSSLK